MEITKFGGSPYAKLSVTNEDCRKSCLYDCYCGAYFYSNGTYHKLKLSLMFVVNDQSPTTTLFIKWSAGNPNLSILKVAPLTLNEREEVDSKNNLIRVLPACLGSIMFLCFLIAISSLLVYKIQVNRYQMLSRNSNLAIKKEFILQPNNYNELEQTTNRFQEGLGRCYFGAVYKGAICEGNKSVAVKQLENPMEEGERKFYVEMVAVGRTHHKNLVRLFGFFIQSLKKFLVFEFISRGSLENLVQCQKRSSLERKSENLTRCNHKV